MTHKERVLRLLADNEPHSHLEGYRLGVMLHSRVADLRKDGYTIKCWAEGGLYLYQLFGTVPATGSNGPNGDATAEGVSVPPLQGQSPPELSNPVLADGGAPPAGPDLLPVDPGRQLSVFEAAA